MGFLEKGTFTVGCNYWASHAGTGMWRDWQADIVEDDLKRLSAHGIKTLRIFPLWSDFQPVRAMYGQAGVLREFRMGEEPLPDTFEGQAGMSLEMLEHFGEFCRIAGKYDMQLIVGLVAGWMSGRLFVPEALQGRNIITDPIAITWQVRYVRCLVRRFKNEDVIAAWDLGNECNVMAPFDTAEQLYAWAAAIAGAIRMEDSDRPVISGMHGLLPEGKWNIQQQAELTDYLTTHPYALFTPWCDAAPLNTFRTELHGTAETLMYRGIGRKPCFVEESGTLGNMLGDEETAASFVRTCLYSLWAHDCRGYLWWCANEQNHLQHAPYDWCAVERELGLFRADKTPKRVLGEMESFREFLEAFPYKTLPDRITDGVCILTHGQDHWANAYMCFALAKQAGIEIEYAFAGQDIPDAPCYFLPGLCTDSSITAHQLRSLLQKVEDGAVLYISLDDGLISGISDLCQVYSKGRERIDACKPVRITGEPSMQELPVYFAYQMKLETEGARVLAEDAEGIPVCTVCDRGKGHIILMAAPLEMTVVRRNQRLTETPGFYRIYEKVRDFIPEENQKAAGIQNINIGLTEHPLEDGTRLLVLVNYDPEPAEAELHLREGWKVMEYLKNSPQMAGNSCSILRIGKE